MSSKPKKLSTCSVGDHFVFDDVLLPGLFVVVGFHGGRVDVQRCNVEGYEYVSVPSSRLVRKVRVFV